MAMDTFEHPAVPFPVQSPAPFETSSVVFPHLEGCSLLSFSTGLGVVPETTRADAPSGYTIGVEAPQAPTTSRGWVPRRIRRVSVTFPAGTSLSPSAANGLGACQETGAEGINIEGPESEAVACGRVAASRRGALPGLLAGRECAGDDPRSRRRADGSFVPRGPEVRWAGPAGVYPSGCPEREPVRAVSGNGSPGCRVSS